MAHAPGQRGNSRSATWFGALGGAVAWTLHLLLAYIIAEFGCETESDAHMYMGVTLPAWMLLGQSAVMLLLAAAATVCAFRSLKRLGQATPDPTEYERNEAERELARIGVMGGALFLFVIAVQTIPIFFYLSSC